MADQLNHCIEKYVCHVILGFEAGMYKMLHQVADDRSKLLASKHHPFLNIFCFTHEKYYTSTFNSIIKKDNPYLTATFDKLAELSKHTKKCLLNILANLIVSLHFNLDRTNFDISSYESYLKSIEKEIRNTMSAVKLSELFNHVCHEIKDSELVPISEGGKFITINFEVKKN